MSHHRQLGERLSFGVHGPLKTLPVCHQARSFDNQETEKEQNEKFKSVLISSASPCSRLLFACSTQREGDFLPKISSFPIILSLGFHMASLADSV